MKKVSIVLMMFAFVFSASLGASQAQAKEVVLGCNFLLSGPSANIGIGMQRAVNRVADIVNKEGFTAGGEKYVLKPVFYDSKYVPAESVSNIEKMIAEGIKYVYSIGSGCSVPIVEKTTAAKIFQMSYASGSDHLTSPKYPYSFRTVPCNETAFAMYPWLKKTYPNIKRIAHINPSDEAGFTESETRRTCAKNMGYTNVTDEYYKRGATDYYPVATKVIAKKPDFIDFGGTIGRDQALCVKALRELGYTGGLWVGYSDPNAFIKIAGAEAAEGVIFFDSITEATTPKQKEFEKWYLGTYSPPMLATVWYGPDPVFMLVEAIKAADSVDPVKVSKAMRTVTWEGLYGKMYFGMGGLYGHDCSMCRDVPVGIGKGGKPVHLTTVHWPSADVVKQLLQ